MTNCTYISIALLLNDMHIFEECIRSSLGSSCLRWSLSPTSVSFRLHPIPRLVFSSLWEKKNCSLRFILDLCSLMRWPVGLRQPSFPWFLNYFEHLSSLSIFDIHSESQASQVALMVKSPPASAGDIRDMGLIPGSGRSSGRGNDNPLQYSCLENPLDRGAWQAIFHRVAKSRTQLQWLNNKNFLRIKTLIDLTFAYVKHKYYNSPSALLHCLIF